MTLDEKDHLTFQLYIASKTKRIQNIRLKSWIYTTVALASLAFLFHISNNKFLRNYFLAFTILSAFLYPFYSRYRYKKHYARHVRENLKNMINTPFTIRFDETSINTVDKTGSTTTHKTEITEIIELNEYFFLKTTYGYSMVIPKRQSSEIPDLDNQLNEIVKQGASYTKDLDWAWK